MPIKRRPFDLNRAVAARHLRISIVRSLVMCRSDHLFNRLISDPTVTVPSQCGRSLLIQRCVCGLVALSWVRPVTVGASLHSLSLADSGPEWVMLFFFLLWRCRPCACVGSRCHVPSQQLCADSHLMRLSALALKSSSSCKPSPPLSWSSCGPSCGQWFTVGNADCFTSAFLAYLNPS